MEIEFVKGEKEYEVLSLIPEDKDQAILWLRELAESTFSFHIEDEPREVGCFSDEQANHIDNALEACALALGSHEAVLETYFEFATAHNGE